MKVQIVIPCINLWAKYTKPCIDSIKTKYEHRILLIDNGSSDETKEEASKLVSATFAHKRNEEPWGCAQSWNYGVKDAFERGYDYVVILNNDIILHPEAIDRLINRFTGDVVMTSCLNIRGEVDNPLYVLNLKSEDKKDVPESEHPDFSAFAISKECWDKIGTFDDNFKPAYFEDNDYHHRIQLANAKAVCVPTAMFYHFGSRTQNEATNAPICSSPQFERNREYYQHKWGGVPGQETYLKPFNE